MLDQNDRLYRLPNTKFDQMLRDPASHLLPRFAGRRVRMAETIVELAGRQPIQAIRITFDMLTFDDDGRFDASTFERQQFARAELAMAPLIIVPDDDATVVDAASRFVELGGRWAPSRPLARAVEDAAMGRMKCPRL